MPRTNQPTQRKVVDWDALAPHYRAGIRALKDIGSEFGVSDAAIIKHARKQGWTRDLQGKIKAKAEAKVSAATVSAEVSEKQKITEALTVEVEATVQARIRLAHRADIARARGMFRTLLGELEAVSAPEGRGMLDQLVDLVNGSDDSEDAGAKRAAKMRQVLDKAIDGPSRVLSAKQLTDMLEKLIRLEREAFHIGSEQADPDARTKSFLESMLDARARIAAG